MQERVRQRDFETEAFQKAAKANVKLKQIWGKRDKKKAVDDLVGVFYDPVIMFTSAWMDTLPEWIKPEITTQRLLHLIKHKDDMSTTEAQMATDIEAMAYMYPASLEFPLNYHWTQVYLYLTTKCLERTGKKIPDDVRVDKLRPDELRERFTLKSWLYKKRIEERKRRIRAEKLPTVQVEEKPDTQRSLF
jgi:hypothetical protein